ncbi:MAG: MaoC/PaaZ C-terminal domain-containing protein [Pseudomonadota bacterium]
MLDPVYLEDLEVGRVYETGTIELTAERIKAFAAEYDPQPMHLSDEGAEGTIFGSLTASGWQICALTMRLIVDSKFLGSTPLIGAEISQVRFAQPAKPGMVLKAVVEILELDPGSRPDRGFAEMSGTTIDTVSSQPVLTQNWRMLMPKRPG